MALNKFTLVFVLTLIISACHTDQNTRQRIDFDDDWKFYLGDEPKASSASFDDSAWRTLNLPHDWSIEGSFSKKNQTKTNGGALPAGIGWYRKSFTVGRDLAGKHIFIDFDGVYRNSEVWINSHYLGKRPFGYNSFRYELTPFLNLGDEPNVLAVRVDNSLQPNSRWYTGSGIYRNVWLVATSPVHVAHWGTFITTSDVSEKEATIKLQIKINVGLTPKEIKVETTIVNPEQDKIVTVKNTTDRIDSLVVFDQQVKLSTPELWSNEHPELYTAKTLVYADGKVVDNYETPFGIRYFAFDPAKGFSLNGKPMKLLGVNNHHDQGALGAAFSVRAAERQLEILKAMGCNAIRTAHNPPAPELLDLCDRMGFLVMDEAFDTWTRGKMDCDFHLDWPVWHRRELEDMVLRDRNHPSVILWSIGNEIPEQFDTTGIKLAKELADIVKNLDKTRPVTSALTEQDPAKNNIYKSKALDLIGFNYKHLLYASFPKNFPGEKMLAAENMSAFSTRGHYDMPSDSVRIWPKAYKQPFDGNPDLTASAYDNCHAYWGATHEETWKVIKNNDFISGMFVWSGFDFLGEPEPYPWPARSSYYGVIDLCGFPKDIYYFYQSEWTTKTMLHLFPHWNWNEGQTVDVWSYYNNADEVELFVNGISQGVSSKSNDRFHAFWRVKYVPGILKAVSRKAGKTVLEEEIRTAGKPAKIELVADRSSLKADGKDLSFITVKVIDEVGNMVPDASNLINFDVQGNGFIAGVDNGCQTSMEPFKTSCRKAFNGLCLLLVQTTKTAGKIQVKATSQGLKSAEIQLTATN